MTEYQTPDLPEYPVHGPEELQSEGDYLIDKIVLYAYNGAEYDLTNIFNELNIYEDVFGGFMHGSLYLSDAIDLPQLYPLIGQEKLQVVFTRPEIPRGRMKEEVNVEFRVYKLANRKQVVEKGHNFVLYFCTPEQIQNEKKRVWKSYKDKLNSEIVTDIYDKCIAINKGIAVEETLYKQNWAIPHLEPLTAINMLASKSISAETDSADFVFYEDKDEFHFTTLSKLIEEPPVTDLIYQPANFWDEGKEKFNRQETIEPAMRAVQNLTYRNGFNVLEDLMSGLYGGQLQTVDFVRELRAKIDLKYNEEFEKFKHLDKNKPFTDDSDLLGAPEAYLKLMITNLDHDQVDWIVEKDPEVKPFHLEEYALHRPCGLQRFRSNGFFITLPGDPRRKVGQTVNFVYPSMRGDVREKVDPDKYLSGKYLITALRHRVKINSYIMEAEIVKDSFVEEIEHQDIIEILKGIY